MKKYILILALVAGCSLIARGAICAPSILPKEEPLVEKTLAAEELVFQGHYNEALAIFNKIDVDYPDSLTGMFGQMVVYQLQMFENLDFKFRDEYSAVENRFEKVLKKRAEWKGAGWSTWELFIAGAGDGMRAFYRARDEKWFQALGSAVRCIRYFKQARWQDPEFVDALLGIGMYTYWRSAYTKDIGFLPFFSDKRKEGIADVTKVVTDGKYAFHLAKINLALIYYNEKDYAKSLEIIKEMAKKYPKNIIIKQMEARIYYRTLQYAKAIPLHEEVLKLNPTNTLSYYNLATNYAYLKKYAKARELFNKFLSTEPTAQLTKQTKEWFVRLDEMEKSGIPQKDD